MNELFSECRRLGVQIRRHRDNNETVSVTASNGVIAMHDFQLANDNRSLPIEMVALESTTNKMYCVPVAAHVLTLVGYPLICAASPADAIANVQALIATGTLDPDLEMQGPNSGYTMAYKDVAQGVESIIDVLEEFVDVETIDDAEQAS
jgi:hypothetical protein